MNVDSRTLYEYNKLYKISYKKERIINHVSSQLFYYSKEPKRLL